MEYLKSLMEERETLAATIETYASKAAERGSDLSDSETAEVKRIQARCAEIDDRLATFAQAQESSKAYADLSARMGRTQAEQREAVKTETTEVPSLGQAFVESDEFRSYGGHGTSGRMVIEERAVGPILTADLPSIPKARVNVVDPLVRYPLFGVVGRERVSSGSFEYVRVDLNPNAAAVVAEGTAKPQSDLVETLTPGTLDTIAHWVSVSRQALEDRPRLASIIDGKLTEGVLRKVHASILDAMTAATLPTAEGASLMEAIRVGMATVEDAGFSPNAVVLNPADWAALDIAAMAATQVGPVIRPTFWGLQVVSASAQTAGTATVGDFSAGATLFERSGVNVYTTDSHADTFTSNLFTVLAEIRAKAVVTNAAAFAECAETAP